MAEAAKYKKSKAKKNTVKVAFVFWTLSHWEPKHFIVLLKDCPVFH